MGEPVKGDIVVVLFPFSDLSNAKKRPALVLATPDGEDVILCQITSRLVSDRYAVLIGEDDFSAGSLRQESNVRPTRIFTADKKIIQYIAGHLKDDVMERIVNRLIDIVRA
ncbi:type II toxin-antitoxin system PemK/MazF family toxin [uncultured Methanoregula sp.]|uniref:type II toxin-antitoxin system PemK/MazF family toxin n=1 Tax=uncultured Methanoregula sp. TaxID=1005933 RepID=UPI002AABACCD|nr:type II toxin-antitoxin system PemK/MazF family toxin [uncultured Methanoregula sp.]